MATPTASQLKSLKDSIEKQSSKFSSSAKKSAVSSIDKTYGSGSSVPKVAAATSVPKAGSTGNAAGSQSPVAATPLSGTTGNAAGSKLPVGMSTMNSKAASSAASVGTAPKQEDWQKTLASVQASDARSKALGGQAAPTSSGYGMTKDPNYVAPKPTQTASAFDAYSAASNNRVNKDLQVLKLGTASGSGIASSDLMTKADGSNSVQKTPTPNYNFIANSSGPLSNSTAAVPATNTASAIGGSPTPESQTPVQESAPQQISQPTTQSSFGVDNTIKKGPSLDEIQATAGIADETRAQADAAEQAVASATTDEDRLYYQDLADDARREADRAQQDYEKLLQQSDEERAVQAQLDNEMNALQLGKTDVAGQPIPLSFITGQQSALERRSLDRTAPLTSKLGQLQSARQAAMAGAKSQAGIAQNRASSAESNLESLTAEQRKRKNQLEDRDYDTANDRTVLSPGQQQFDSKGNLIASVAPKPTTTNTTPSGVKANTYKDAQQIPESLRNSVLDDIVMNQGSLPDVIAAYPEISANVIQALFNQFSMQGTNINSSGREI